MFTITKPFPNLNYLHFNFNSRYMACSHFIRLQEFYESPFDEIRNHNFDLEDFMDVYAERMGDFSYFTDWNGFNVPGNIIKSFYPNRPKEINLINAIHTIITLDDFNSGNFYITGCKKESSDVMHHEQAHAMFYLAKNYKKEMNKLIKNTEPNKINDFKNKLKNCGYCNSVLNDEVHAYLSTSDQKYLVDRFQVKFSKSVLNQFSKIYNVYLNNFMTEEAI